MKYLLGLVLALDLMFPIGAQAMGDEGCLKLSYLQREHPQLRAVVAAQCAAEVGPPPVWPDGGGLEPS